MFFFEQGMLSIKDWVLSQLVSKSLASSRPLLSSDSFLSEEPIDEFGGQGSTHTSSGVTRPLSVESSPSSSGNLENQNTYPLQEAASDRSFQSGCGIGEKSDPLAKIEGLQIKFLRLIKRIGLTKDNLVASKVLYRLHLATLIRAEESDLKRLNRGISKAQAISAEHEAAGLPLDFSFRMLVLGRTGVGKSSTINSIFDQSKAATDAFRPATRHVQEIIGTLHGIKISFIDTPGLLPSSPSSSQKNRGILHSVKRFIRKSPPDMVLFFERLDLISTGYSDIPLLKLITEVFGSAIWFNTILVMTHSSSALPEGPNGYPVNYESYIAHCTESVQHYIHQALSDTKLENPVVLVENHPNCRRNRNGEKILPDGQVWKSQFLLLCICTKVLSDVNALSRFKNGIQLGPSNISRLPSLPHLLSSFLKRRFQLRSGGPDIEVDEGSFLDLDEEEEYDQLPPIRILTRAQFEKLTKSQKKEYLDELDYRETLYLKKQLKEELRTRMEQKLSRSESSDSDDNHNVQEDIQEPVLLPDMAVPPSFDSDCPVHRYRCLITTDQWLARPVLDPHGWDHDVSFDGINLETTTEIRKNIFTSVTGQMNKDKQDFSIQSECSATFVDPRGPAYSLGLDVQSAGKDLISTIHGNTKVRNYGRNVTECGISLTSFRNKYFVGAKLEDSILIGKRLKLASNFARMGGAGQVAYGGSLETTLRGKNYPVRNDFISLAFTCLSFNKEMVFGGSVQSDFRLKRGTTVSVNANVNSRKMGQVVVKTSSSEHVEIALVAILPILRALFRRKANDSPDTETLEVG